MMTNETIEFLKGLQHEMSTQDHVCQASPRFWVVGDYKWQVALHGCGERTAYYCFDLCEDDSLSLKEIAETLYEHLEENHEDDEEDEDGLDRESLKDLIEVMDIGDTYDLEEKVEELLEELGFNYNKFDESFEHFICPNTHFLTNREAKEHIANNRHHYSSKAHSYAMTAWRSPQVEKLYAILEQTDWDALKDVMTPQTETTNETGK